MRRISSCYPLLLSLLACGPQPSVSRPLMAFSASGTVAAVDSITLQPGQRVVILAAKAPVMPPVDSTVTPPLPPPVSTRRGIGLGPFNGTAGNGATLFANADSPGGLEARLAAARAGGYCIRAVPTGGKHSKYAKGGKWDYATWASFIDQYASKSALWASYAKDGTLCGVSIIDEPQAPLWLTISISFVLVDKAACHAQAIFPGATIYTRTDATDIPAGLKCLKGAMLQYSASKGDVKAYAAQQIAAAKAKGLVLTIGVNAENGGKKVAGCPASQTRPGACQMSGAELLTYFAAMDADTSLVCAGTLWFDTAPRWDTYRARPDQKAALAKLTTSWRTRTRPARC